MKLITDTWRGLLRRKLWPVALALVAALAAVPVLLAKEPEVTVAPANAAAAADEGLPSTYVTATGDDAEIGDPTGKRRYTLGKEKDPFEPAPLPKAKKAKKAKKDKAKTEKAEKADESAAKTETETQPKTDGGGGASAPATSEPVATPTPTPTPKAAPANSVRVRFLKLDETGEATETKPVLVRKLEVLPDDTNPLLVFQGLEKHGKVAVFELTGTVTVEGDGECKPSPQNCSTLRLRAGETQFVTVTDTGEATDAQYQIDLVKINP